jgi:hypothetical protein
LALGAAICQTEVITDAQFRASSEALIEYITDEDIAIASCVLFLFQVPLTE